MVCKLYRDKKFPAPQGEDGKQKRRSLLSPASPSPSPVLLTAVTNTSAGPHPFPRVYMYRHTFTHREVCFCLMKPKWHVG